MKNFRYGSMKVYTKTETGDRVYMGRCKVRRDEGGYCVRICEKQYRLSATGIFLIVPSRLFYMLHRRELMKVNICGSSQIVPIELMIAIEGKIC